MKKRWLAFSSIFLSSLVQLSAEVVAINQILYKSANDGTRSYSIPQGKILIVEHFIWSQDNATPVKRVAITPASRPGIVGDFLLNFADVNPLEDRFTPPRPIKIVGGGSAKISIPASGRDVMFLGLLVDEEDLYAAKIPSELNNGRFENGRLLADVKISSPRPAIITVKAGEELTTLNNDESVEITKTSANQAIASVVADTSKKFMTVEAVALPQD